MSSNPCDINWSNPAEILTKAPACLWQSIQGLPQTIVSGLQGAIGQAWSTISGIAQNIWNGIQNFISAAGWVVQQVAKTMQDIGSAILNGIMAAGSMLLGAIDTIKSFIAGGIQWLYNSMVNLFTGGMQWLKDKVSHMLTFVESGATELFGHIANAVWGWVQNTIVDRVLGYFTQFKETLEKYVINVVLHNMPAALTSFVMGELLYRLPKMFESPHSPDKAIMALLMTPLVVPIGGALFANVLQTKGFTDVSRPFTPKTTREVKQINEALQETVGLSSESRLRLVVFLVKEMGDVVQGVGRARIIQMQVRRPALEYDVNMSWSAVIARAVPIEVKATVRSSVDGSVTVAVTKTVEAVRSVTVSVQAPTVTTVKTIEASKNVTVSVQSSVKSYLYAKVSATGTVQDKPFVRMLYSVS
ncbi:MAG: phage tail protein, partial [Bacteroidota bacterium]